MHDACSSSSRTQRSHLKIKQILIKYNQLEKLTQVNYVRYVKIILPFSKHLLPGRKPQPYPCFESHCSLQPHKFGHQERSSRPHLSLRSTEIQKSTNLWWDRTWKKEKKCTRVKTSNHRMLLLQ